VVDRHGAAGHGSTSASAGIVRVHATSIDSVVLAEEGLAHWESWHDFLDAPADEPLASFRRCGTVVLADGTDYTADVAAALTAVGSMYERWSHDTLAGHLPDFDLSRFGPPRLPEDEAFWDDPVGVLDGAVYTPASGFVADPALAAQNLLAAAVRAGCSFRPAAEVMGLAGAGTRITGLEFADGSRVSCPVVLNAAGPESARLNRLAGADRGMAVQTRAMRQELHHVPAPPGVDWYRDGVHVVDGDLGINFRPEVGNALLVGGNGAACDGETWVDPAGPWSPAATQAAWNRHVLRLARRMPGLRVPSRPSGVAGLYDVTPDWLPVYDRTDVPGFYVAIGTSGNQFKTAPLVGELMAELIETVEGGRDTDDKPLVVAGTRTGRDIELAAYSRRREPAPDGVRG
jgi:sarcosine oxidase subunit beta